MTERYDELGRRLCEGLTKRQTPCKAQAMDGSPFCVTHDPRYGGMSPKWQAIAARRHADKGDDERGERDR